MQEKEFQRLKQSTLPIKLRIQVAQTLTPYFYKFRLRLLVLRQPEPTLSLPRSIGDTQLPPRTCNFRAPIQCSENSMALLSMQYNLIAWRP